MNPGPVTVLPVFYVRSLLAVWLLFCPQWCRRQLLAGIFTVKVPESPCDAAIQASPLNDVQLLPEDERE